MVDECNRTWHSSIARTESSISDVDATAIIYNVNISISRYQMIRSFCLPLGPIFSTKNAINQVKKTFHPPISSFQMKSSVEITSILQETVIALIKARATNVFDGDVFHFVGKFDVDGSGSHKI